MHHRDVISGGIAALGGAALVLWVFGAHILPPWNTGWMLSGQIGPDPVQYWLGFTFFKQSPWLWPPGLNPRWGIEVSSAIFYADSIPLLAFIFKALDPVLRVDQYWGLWLTACGALQGWMAWRIIGLATPAPWPRVLGALLLVMQPVLLNRMGGHFALGGQFLILIALWLCLTCGGGWRRGLAWGALVLAASLIHSYLLPMVAGLWAADWLARVADPARRRPGLVLEAPLVPGAGVFGLYLAGFFTLRGGFGGTWGGYGHMQLDLLAPFSAGVWSRFLPAIPEPDHLEVGHSTPGLGGLLLMALGIWAAWPRARAIWRGHWPLILACFGMWVLAVTHRISIAGQVVELFILPARVDALADALRASERFFWPALYAALLGAVLALLRRVGPARASAVLAVLLVGQFADLQPGFARLARYFTPPAAAVLPLRLHDPFWLEAATRYDRIRLVPTGMQAAWWEEVAVLAATRGLETDAVYLARIDPARVAAVNSDMARRLGGGDWEPRTLYVLGDEGAIALARASHDPARDLIAEFNLVWVLAPGWFSGPGNAAPASR